MNTSPVSRNPSFFAQSTLGGISSHGADQYSASSTGSAQLIFPVIKIFSLNSPHCEDMDDCGAIVNCHWIVKNSHFTVAVKVSSPSRDLSSLLKIYRLAVSLVYAKDGTPVELANKKAPMEYSTSVDNDQLVVAIKIQVLTSQLSSHFKLRFCWEQNGAEITQTELLSDWIRVVSKPDQIHKKKDVTPRQNPHHKLQQDIAYIRDLLESWNEEGPPRKKRKLNEMTDSHDSTFGALHPHTTFEPKPAELSLQQVSTEALFKELASRMAMKPTEEVNRSTEQCISACYESNEQYEGMIQFGSALAAQLQLHNEHLCPYNKTYDSIITAFTNDSI